MNTRTRIPFTGLPHFKGVLSFATFLDQRTGVGTAPVRDIKLKVKNQLIAGSTKPERAVFCASFLIRGVVIANTILEVANSRVADRVARSAHGLKLPG